MESLEVEGKPERAGDLITIPFMGAGDFFTIPFVGTFFFFPAGALTGGKGAERLSPRPSAKFLLAFFPPVR